MGKKQKIQVILIVVLLLALAAVWYLAIFGLPGGAVSPPEREGERAPLAPAEVRRVMPDLPPDEVIRSLMQKASAHLAAPSVDPDQYVEDSRDIFTPPVAVPRVRERIERIEEEIRLGFALTAILWSEENPLALINNRVVGAGDLLDEHVRVGDISPDSVILEVQYEEITATIDIPLKTE